MLRKTLMAAALVLSSIGASQAADKVSLLLDWYVNPDHAPIFAAEQIGAFAEEGLEVEIIPPADPSMPPRLVAAKQGDFAISYQPQLYMYAQEGLPLVRVGTIVSTPLNTLTVLKSSGIEKMADLKGKKIGFSVSGLEEATLGAMLKEGGLTMADVTLINVNFNLVSSLISGQVDAVIGGYRNFEATMLREEGVEGRLFNVEDHGVPAYDELIVLVHKDDVGSEKVAKFMRALKKGNDYLLANSDAALAYFLKKFPDLDNNLNRTAWKDTMPLFAKDPLKLDVARYEAYGKFLLDSNLIKQPVPVSDIAVELK